MENDLYLILHRVRRKAAFDVAKRMKIGNDDGWIIPTSGHRAYPYWWRAIEELPIPHQHSMPEDWPDHYSCNDQVIPKHKIAVTRKPGRIDISLLMEDEV